MYPIYHPIFKELNTTRQKSALALQKTLNSRKRVLLRHWGQGEKYSNFYGVWVRPEITREFTDKQGRFDDMMAGLHEIRARMAEKRSRQKQPA